MAANANNNNFNNNKIELSRTVAILGNRPPTSNTYNVLLENAASRWLNIHDNNQNLNSDDRRWMYQMYVAIVDARDRVTNNERLDQDIWNRFDNVDVMPPADEIPVEERNATREILQQLVRFEDVPEVMRLVNIIMNNPDDVSIQLCLLCITHDPTNHPARIKLGDLYCKRSLYLDAIRLYEEANRIQEFPAYVGKRRRAIALCVNMVRAGIREGRIVEANDLEPFFELNDFPRIPVILTAATVGNLEIVERVAQEINMADAVNEWELLGSHNGWHALHFATANNRMNVIQWFFRNHLTLLRDNKTGEGMNNGRESALIISIRNQCWEAARFLSNNHIAVNDADQNGNTPLIWLVDKWANVPANFRGLLGALLNAGANVQHRNLNGVSALEKAITKEHVNVVTQLLDRGAQITERERNAVKARIGFGFMTSRNARNIQEILNRG